MIDKEKLLEWIKQLILVDGWVGELKDTQDLTLLKILEQEIKDGRFEMIKLNKN